MVQMNFIFIFISSSDTNVLRKKSVKQKIKKLWPNKKNNINPCKLYELHHEKTRFLHRLKQSLSGNTLRVGYHLCIRHILGTVFELYQSSENTHRYFHIIKAKNMYRPSYAA